MVVKHISAITLAVRDMARAVDFYTKLDLKLEYGGEAATFTTFQAGEAYINLTQQPDQQIVSWGRVILRVEDVDALYRRFNAQGLSPEAPRDAEWGERYFHMRDPDGHELSFAQLLPT